MAVDPQHTNNAIDAMSAVTTIHVVLMAALAVVMIAAIWYGATLARRRKTAQAQVREDFETAKQHDAVTKPTASIDDPAPLSADVAQTPAVPPSAEPQDSGDLTQIKGLGPKLAATLAAQGITSLGQIASLTPEAAADLDARLGAFQGRMVRDRWIEQAKLLSTGDRAGYEAAFGKLGG